ncbi:hypothetical protein LTR87_018027 [Friedmanniomyces endolithicus]|nr:hypothetical protein LTR87_018027 [Friedmanniomyces endolithicus]
MEFPSLPELVDDMDRKSPLALETPATNGETPTATGVRAYNFLRCPQCDSVLKWMFVKQSKDGLHQIQGCAPASDIEDATALAGKWPSKAVVIAAAIQYIAQLELERGQANAQNSLLCEQVEGLQRLVRCDDCSIVKYLEAIQPRVLFDQ